MIVASICVAMLAGAVAAIVAWLCGAPWWLALLVYSGVGSLALVATTVFVAGHERRRARRAKMQSAASALRIGPVSLQRHD